MTAEAPDPKTFQSWEDAFQYPIPAVRGMERQLRRDVDSSMEKLRVLVGGSYRDLLGTAESIVEMDVKMQKVEAFMGDIGRNCNTRILERKSRNMARWSESVEAKDTARYTFTSQLAVLRSCPDAIKRLLKQGGSLLAIAKVLVLARLLHTRSSKRPNAPPYLDVLRSRLASLRERLLTRIQRRFQSLKAEREALVEAMCAFAISTSSSPTDVIRHFHNARLEAISEHMEAEGPGMHSSILEALQLYVKTLQDTKAMIPGQLSLALQGIKTVPIFQSLDMKALPELNLDIYQKWIDEDIKGFTPYIRHDELNRADADKLVRAWATKTIRMFSKRLETRLSSIGEFSVLMQLRKELLEVWLSQHNYSVGVNASEVLDGLRDVFNNRAETLIKGQCSALQEVERSTQAAVGSDWQPDESGNVTSLWSPAFTSMDTSKGAKAFRQQLLDVTAGKNAALSQICDSYATWRTSIESTETLIQQSKATKWNDVIDDLDDEDDVLDNKQTLLSHDDPNLLASTLQESLRTAFSSLASAFESTASTLINDPNPKKLVFLLRLLREIRAHLPQPTQKLDLSPNLIASLQSQIAASTLKLPLQAFSKRFARSVNAATLPSRALWEGDPELPVLPSTCSYRLLLELTRAMAELGPDVWSPAAVSALKIRAAKGLAEAMERGRREISGVVNGDVNGDEGKRGTAEQAGEAEDNAEKNEVNGQHRGERPEDEETVKNEKILQQIFDVQYLGSALRTKGAEEKDSGLQRVGEALIREVDLDAAAGDRIRRAAEEYWTRTSLLFGLLA